MKTILLTALLVALPVASAAAQAPAALVADASTVSQTVERLTLLRGLTDSPVEPLAKTLARQLRTSNAANRAEGLQETVYYAAHFSDLVDFTPLIPSLLHIIERDSNPMHRVMASQALCHIGDRDSIEEMVRLVRHDRDRQVQKRILYAATATLSGMR